MSSLSWFAVFRFRKLLGVTGLFVLAASLDAFSSVEAAFWSLVARLADEALAFFPSGAGVGGGLDNCCGSGLMGEAAFRVAAERVILGAMLEMRA